MVKTILKQKLLKTKRLTRLKLSKKLLESKPIITERTVDQMISHIEPIKIFKPFYQGGKIQIQNGVIYTCFDNSVLYEESKISHHSEEIINFAVSNQNDYIATFTRNYMVRYQSLSDNAVLFTQKIEPLFAIDMAFSPEDVFLALGGTNCIVKILNVKKNVLATEFRVSGSVQRIAWAPIMRKLQLAVATDDRRVSLFDLVANRVLCAFTDFQSRITGLCYQSHILVTSSSKQIKLWDTGVQKLLETVETEYEIEAMGMVKHTIIMGTKEGQILIKNPNKPIQIENALEGQEIMKIMYSEDQVYIATSELHIYITSLSQTGLTVNKLLLGFNDEILHVKFLPNNQLLLATNSPFMKIIDLDSMEVLAWKAHFSVIMCCEYVDGLIVTASKDNCVSIFKYMGFKIPQQLHKYTGHSDDVVSIDVTRKFIASVSSDKTLKIWDLLDYSSDQSMKTVIAHEKDINCVTISPNCKMIATSSQDRLIKLWDDQLMLKMVLKGHKRGVWDIKFSPVEKLLASASGDNTLKIWNLSDGSVVKSLQGTSPQLKVQWLFKGQELISGDASGNLKLWNIKKQICINTFSQHEGKIYALDMKRERNDFLIISGGDDSKIVIWKDATVQMSQEQQLKQHDIKIKLQSYQDFIRNGQFVEAAFLAYQNNYVKHFIEATMEIVKGEHEEMMKELSKKLIEDDLAKYLTLLCQLNISKKTCPMSQQLFYNSIRQIKLTKEHYKEKKEQIQKLLQQFRFTSMKYYERMDENYRQTFLLKYMIDKNRIIV